MQIRRVFAPSVLLLAFSTACRGADAGSGSDFVLGVWKDEMDVERVRMYALRKE